VSNRFIAQTQELLEPFGLLGKEKASAIVQLRHSPTSTGTARGGDASIHLLSHPVKLITG
jgi:hypothetical protein